MRKIQMNERIKELEKLATEVEHSHGAFGEYEKYYRLNTEKFAELIVRECANHCDLLLDHKISSEWARGTHDCSKAIKKHFGVKE